MKISFELIPENDSMGLYYVDWEDTLGKAEGYNSIDRPAELWCIIRNKKGDTVNYYRGLSTPQTFLAFQTKKDSILSLQFMTGVNIFSEVFQSGTEKERKEYFEQYNPPLVFKPITIDLAIDMRKTREVVLQPE